MRWMMLGLALLVAGCGRSERGDEVRDEAGSAQGGPNVAVTRVPGVSLTYRYGFRLPIERIIAVQEEHASKCEAMTAVRCRVTGMTYEVGRNRRIMASLELKLAPDIARRFGKQAVDIVVSRGGMLADAALDSEDTGAEIEAVDRDLADVAGERSRISTQLSKPGLSASERTQLQSRLDELSDQERQSRTIRGEAALKLANTPMTFHYQSGDVDPGLSDGPILGAVKDGWANIVTGFAAILVVLITLIPWLATFAILFWLWRRFGTRIGLRNGQNGETSE